MQTFPVSNKRNVFAATIANHNNQQSASSPCTGNVSKGELRLPRYGKMLVFIVKPSRKSVIDRLQSKFACLRVGYCQFRKE